MSEKATIRDGSARVRRLRERSDLKRGVGDRRRRLREADRVYADGLAMVRKAAELTQVQLAKELGITQGAVAKLEGRRDLLLSTLTTYAEGVGARLHLLIEFDDGREVELDLDNMGDA